jgi:hydroxymethylpyrimidine pyrophosphatase-like HAD family hydrolase
MRYMVLASDYDGTLARHGKVRESTLKALEELRSSGRKLVLVTGRHLPDLRDVFPEMNRFDRVVAENGSLLYEPASRHETPLCERANKQFLQHLKKRKIPFSSGRCIVATWEPHQASVLEVIRELGLDLQVVFNKGAVMVLPSGVNKSTGLKAALREMGLSAHNVVGVGDAENDHPFLAACECSVAVANALDTLKERVDVVTQGENGAGMEELIRQLIEDDLARYDDRPCRPG